jgi:hypothetical protein
MQINADFVFGYNGGKAREDIRHDGINYRRCTQMNADFVTGYNGDNPPGRFLPFALFLTRGSSSFSLNGVVF